MIITVKRIRSADGGGAVVVEFEIRPDDGSGIAPGTADAADGKEKKEYRSLMLLPAQYRELDIRRGVIGEEFFDRILEASRICEAVRRGAGMLSYGAQSCRALEMKLRRAGFPQECAARAVETLCGEGYIDERRDALREAERALARGWGKRRVLSHLYGRGYRDEALSGAGEYLDGMDFSVSCREVILKKYPQLLAGRNTERAKTAEAAAKLRREREKCVAALMRLGFSSSDIRDALSTDDRHGN